MKNTFELDGNKMQTKNAFYKEIERKLTSGLDWKIGRNLDAFDDVLEGGFGTFNYGEKISIKWTSFRKSKNGLDNNFLSEVLDIIENHENVEKLIIEK